MQKKIPEEKLQALRNTGISEFASKGLDGANINVIARKAGVSVGTIYNYFGTKENFFTACLEQAMKDLETALMEASAGDVPLLTRADRLIRAVQSYSRENIDVIRLYNEITSSSGNKMAGSLARKIESISSSAYKKTIREAARKGEIRSDVNVEYLAFFFDNLLTTLQFSYACPYYKERLKIYCGEEGLKDDDLMRKNLLAFMDAAFDPKGTTKK